jgi:hypothetical protein
LQPAGGAVVTTPTAGSWSTYSFQGGNAGLGGHFSITATGELYHGFRFYTLANTIRVMNYVSPNAVHNARISLNAASRLEISRGDGTAVLGTGATILATNTWYYIEVYLLISDTVGKAQVKLNGVDEIALLTGQDTRADAGAGGDTIDRICVIPDNVNVYVDDMYVNDTTGSYNTGFAGDTRIVAYIPNASGDVTGLTPTSGSNYTNVDERPPNDATDIVSATGTTLYDLYNIPNTSGVASVQAVTLWLRAQKSDAGAKNVAHIIKSGSTESSGSDIALSTSWAYYGKHYSIDPTDSAQWTASKVDSLQIGSKAR